MRRKELVNLTSLIINEVKLKEKKYFMLDLDNFCGNALRKFKLR